MAIIVRDEQKELPKQYNNDRIEVKIGDYANLKSLEKAVIGTDVLYFVSGGDNDQRSRLYKNVVDAAKQAGIKHILYISGIKKRRK